MAALSNSASLQPGDALGTYRILSRLGAGGMGAVYLAEGSAGERVALKVIHSHLADEPGFEKRFLREGEIGRRIRHPNVVSTLEASCEGRGAGGRRFLAMELVEGQTLRALLEELGRVPERLCRHIGRETARALEAIHGAGIVHRDLKPENILITGDHEVKVMDLGVARLPDESLLTSEQGAFAGTILYAAPERFLEKGSQPAADLYSLGLILYELATGQHPFRSDDVAEVMHRQIHEVPRPAGALCPQISPFLEDLIRALLAKDPAARPSSAAVVAEALERGEASAWALGRARAGALPARRRTRVTREAALVGRDAEMARLRAAFARAHAGEGRLLLLEGEAGIGKTRLCADFVEALEQEGESFHLLAGTYLPGGAATASGAFSSAFREYFGGAPLEEALVAHLPETPLLAPAFAALLRGEPPPAGQEALTKESLQRVFLQATRSMAAERPVLLLLEDFHCAPPEGLALLAALAATIPGERVLLLATLRPGLPPDWLASLERLEQTERILLGRLGPKDLARLLAETFRSERLAEELSFKIAQKSDGNPLFVFEILRSLRENRLLQTLEDGSYVRTRVIERIAIPSSLVDLIQARIAELAAEDRDLLEVAACCGPEFDPGLAAEAAGVPLVPALKRFAAIERVHRLIRSSGRLCLFDHNQVQEALYHGLLAQLREQYHLRIAEALERRGARPAGAEGVALCEHYLKSSQPHRALPLLAGALAQIERGYGNEAPIQLAALALQAPGLLQGRERAGLLREQAGYLDLAGRRGEQGAALDEACALAAACGAADLELAVRQDMAWLATETSRYEEARRLLEEIAPLVAASHSPAARTRQAGLLAIVFFELGRLDEAQAQASERLALARAVGDRREEAGALGNLGHTLRRFRRFDDARACYEGQLKLAREQRDRRGEAVAWGNLGNVAADAARRVEARDCFLRYLALSREIGFRRGEARAAGALAIEAKHLGRFAEAEEHYATHLAISREVSSGLGEGYALANLARLRGLLGDPEGARAMARQAEALLERIGAQSALPFVHFVLGEVAAMQNRTEEAELRLTSATTGARAQANPALAAIARSELGVLRRDAGMLAEARAWAEEAGEPAAAAIAACRSASLAGGGVAAAEGLLVEHQAAIPHALMLEAHHLLARATGSEEHAAEARRLLAHLLTQAPERCRKAMLEKVPLFRAVAATEGAA
ncbi:MAG: serine/threonine-protein kinase [Planctomycetaceae bacterium]